MFTNFLKLALVSAVLATAQSSMAVESELVRSDLIRVRSRFAAQATVEAVNRHNEAVMASLPQATPGSSRVQSVPLAFADKLMQSIDTHPITSWIGMYKYERIDQGVNIGYCFGRATYAHLALIKNGVDKNAVRKIWAVGPMNTGTIDWAFHVATIVRADNGEWITVDNFPGQVLTVRQWMEHMKLISTDGKLTFYITEAEKFSVSLGGYDRIQLGLDLSPEQDWYRNYFRDLMNWFGGPNARPFFDDNGVMDLRLRGENI